MHAPRPRLNALPALWLLFLMCLLAPALRSAGQTRPSTETRRYFWKVTSGTTTVFLLGSVHVASPDMYPLPPQIEAAFADSDALAVEADISAIGPQIGAAFQVVAEGIYPAGDSLDKHISPGTMKTLREFCATHNLAIETLQHMKPVLVAATIEAAQASSSGYTSDNGIDLHFLHAAKDLGDKKIVELESAEDQIKMLLSMDDDTADDWLASSMKGDSKEELADLIKAWKEGDVSTLEKEMAEEDSDPRARKMQDVLLYQRDDGMVKKIDQMLKGKVKTFVVVGAAHMVGDRGIVKQLEAKGYKVERPRLSAIPPARPKPVENAPTTAPATAPTGA